MKWLPFLIFLSTLGFLNPACSEPTNLDLLKKELQAYQNSGRYDNDISTVIKKAHADLLTAIEKNTQNKKLALILDIDETSLSNYPFMQAHNFSESTAQIHEDDLAATAPPIKPTLWLFNEAIKHHVSVFFITGRPAAETAATKANLLKAGYKDWAGLYLRPDNLHPESIVPFKKHMRSLIQKKGYVIIASIGDQYSDLIGGFAQKTYKLPNPFYFIA